MTRKQRDNTVLDRLGVLRCRPPGHCICLLRHVLLVPGLPRDSRQIVAKHEEGTSCLHCAVCTRTPVPSALVSPCRLHSYTRTVCTRYTRTVCTHTVFTRTGTIPWSSFFFWVDSGVPPSARAFILSKSVSSYIILY